MDPQSSPSYRVAAFLGELQRGVSAGCRAAGDGVTASRLELHYKAALGAPERTLGLRAELRDGVPVIVIHDDADLGVPRSSNAP